MASGIGSSEGPGGEVGRGDGECRMLVRGRVGLPLARIDHQAPGCGLPSLMLRVLPLGTARAGCLPIRFADPCRRLLSINEWRRLAFGCGDRSGLARIDHQAPGCGSTSLMLRVLALGSARAGCPPSRLAGPCRRLLSLNDQRRLACGGGDRSGLARASSGGPMRGRTGTPTAETELRLQLGRGLPEQLDDFLVLLAELGGEPLG